MGVRYMLLAAGRGVHGGGGANKCARPRSRRRCPCSGWGTGFMIGAIIGAIIGYLVSHSFWGILLGGLVGSMLGSSVRRMRPVRPVGDFVEPLFAVLGAVAKADGRVSQSEIIIAERLMARMNLSAEQRRVAIAGFNQGKQPGFDVDA